MQNERSSAAQDVGKWVSVILRVAIASLFLTAAVSKLKGGSASINQTVQGIQAVFRDTWLPAPLVTFQAWATLAVEPLIVVWLISGYRLKLGWIVTGLFLTTLSFGMAVAGKYDVASANYTYVLMACAGLYVSHFDCFAIDALVCKRAASE